jgi:hypothetical protein
VSVWDDGLVFLLLTGSGSTLLKKIESTNRRDGCGDLFRSIRLELARAWGPLNIVHWMNSPGIGQPISGTHLSTSPGIG